MSRTKSTNSRPPGDFYPTPLSAFEPLLPLVRQLNCPVWEPACGDGRLVKAMLDFGILADGDDLNSGYDFLKDTTQRGCILTNPPFSLAQEFCHHALKHSTHVFMLLRLNFLGSLKRKQWWIQHEPSALFVLSQRPSFTDGSTDATDYAWFYWGPAYKGIFHL